MKLTHIDIEKFGAWTDLSLPIAADGLTVLYGPNEAGKSTLLKYIRGMLYGFPSSSQAPLFGRRKGEISHLPWSGSISLEHEKSALLIQRSANSDDHMILSVQVPTEGEPTTTTDIGLIPPDENECLLQQVRQGVDAKLFQQLYAIGLTDLQELATWDDEKIASHLYSLTLGPAGKTLLRVDQAVKKAKAELVSPRSGHRDADIEARSGKVERLMQRYAELNERLDEQTEKVQRYREIVAETKILQDHLAEMKSRRAGLDAQRRGHQFMDRVWGPWSTLQRLRREWKQIPRVKTFPENGLEILLSIEEELDSARRCRDSIRAEIERYRSDLKACRIDGRLAHVANSVRRLNQMRSRVETLSTQLPERQRELGTRREQLEMQCTQLDGDWTPEKLIDTANGTSIIEIHAAADNYRRGKRRRNQLRQRIQHRLKNLRRERNRWKDRLPEVESVAPDQGLRMVKRRCQQADELVRIVAQMQSLAQREDGANERQRYETETTALPAWGWWAVTGFTAFGVLLFIAGLMTGYWQSALAGSIFCLLAIASAAVGYAVRSHFVATTSVDDAVPAQAGPLAFAQLRRRRDELCASLSISTEDRTIEDAVVLTGGETEVAPLLLTAEVSPSLATDVRTENDHNLEVDVWQVLRDAERDVAAWEDYAAWHAEWLVQRRRLTELRKRFHDVQREFAEHRKAWCDVLVRAGLTETLNVSEGLSCYHRLLDAIDAARSWKALDARVAKDRQRLAAYQQQTAKIQKRVDDATDCDLTLAEALKWVERCSEELRQMKKQRRERRQLLKEIGLRRREEADYQQLMQEFQMQAGALMVQGGAANREEFEKRANWFRRRTELRTLIADAKSTLADAARTEPDLAIVESDLEQFDPDENREHLETVAQEIDDLDDDLHLAFEEMGQLKHEMKTLTSDRTSAGVRREREQVLAQLREACTEWCAVDWAAKSLERVQEQYEKTSQPEALAFASKYLEQMTDGRYRRIWTPLGDRRLYVDDAGEQHWTVEQLSNGTREQLFLSVRLALVSQMAKQGVELPIVLDDVLVNFDEHRTTAAVKLLADYSASGQQVILLTCHAHIAAAFDRLGIQSVHLQSRPSMVWERQAG